MALAAPGTSLPLMVELLNLVSLRQLASVTSQHQKLILQRILQLGTASHLQTCLLQLIVPSLALHLSPEDGEGGDEGEEGGADGKKEGRGADTDHQDLLKELLAGIICAAQVGDSCNQQRIVVPWRRA